MKRKITKELLDKSYSDFENLTNISNRGGKRKGSGRPRQEETKVMRYPAALQAEIDAIVKEYKESKQKKKERVVKAVNPSTHGN